MKINRGRIALVLPVLAFALCFILMLLKFITGEMVRALVMMAACVVNLGLVIFSYTRKE